MKTIKKVFSALPLIFFLVITGSPTEFTREQIITNSRFTDGFGSQFQNVIASAVYAELAGKIFAYTPFESMEHNYDADPDFIAKKEWLINFIGNFPTNPFNDIPFKHYKDFFDENAPACSRTNMLRTIKRLFRANKNKNDYFDSQHFNIAIHVRRPNSMTPRLTGSDTPDAVFLAVIETLRKKYQDKNIQFHIQSQGNSSDFAAYNASDVMLHLNESVEDSFAGLVFADVLVCCASSFSYAAALLCDGPVYYIPFWHAPFPDWVSVNTLIPSELAIKY